MLPLHTAIKSIAFAILAAIIFASCSDKSQSDLAIIKTLNESIESSNKMLSTSTMDVMIALRNKMEERATVERAKIWIPKAEKVQQLSKDIFDHLENIKQRIKDNPINTSELFDKLRLYRQQVLEIDPKITNEFEKSLPVFTRSVDSLKNDPERLFKDYFKNTSYAAVIAMLNKVENNIRSNELRIITFCHEQCGSVSLGPDVFFSALVVMNTSVASPGDQLEITAGVGYFSLESTPEFFIYGRPVKIQEDGAAHYNIKAPLRSGKYYVPVKIRYTDQNGKQVTIQKEIEYTVANIQKQ